MSVLKDISIAFIKTLKLNEGLLLLFFRTFLEAVFMMVFSPLISHLSVYHL